MSSALSLPSGGGSMEGLGGSFAPDLNTGGGGYELPIEVPDGRNGHGPSLKLRYATGSPAGPFGLGWDLGLLRLTREPATGADGPFVLAGAGPLRVAPEDADLLLPETDGLVWTVRRAGEGFEIAQRDGVTHVLGASATARIADPTDPSRVTAWLVERTTAPDGEVITYGYAPDGASRLVSSVGWATFRLSFAYEARPDAVLDGRPGFLLTSTQRCRSIALEVAGEGQPVVRRWDLGYAQSAMSGGSLLASVTTVGVSADGTELALPPETFSYRGADAERAHLRPLPAAVAIALLDGASFSDLSGDGLPDVVDLRPGRIAMARNRGSLQFDPMRRIDRAGVPGFGVGVTFAADVTGRGRVDLVSSATGLAYRFPIEGDGEVGRPVVARRGPVQDPAAPGVLVADFDGDRAIDLMSIRNGVLTIDRQHDGGWETTRRRVGAEDALTDVDTGADDVRVASMKGDGLADLVTVRSGEVRWWPALGAARWADERVMPGSPVLPVGYRRDRLFLVDVDGDGCADIVYVDADAVRWWPNRGGNGFGDEVVVPYVPGRLAERVELADLDGAGVPGIVLAGRSGGRSVAWYLSLRQLAGTLLAGVDGGLGDRLAITYASSTGEAARDRRLGRSWSTFLPLAVPVVAAVARTRHRGEAEHVTRYRYHDGAWDSALRRFLGFGQVETLEAADDSAAATRHVSTFHVGRPPERVDAPPTDDERLSAQALRGRLVRSTVHPWDGDAEGPIAEAPALLRIEQDWDAHLVDVAGARSARPRLRERRELHLDGGADAWRTTTTTNVTWDEWENITESVQRDRSSADPTDEQEVRTITTYAQPRRSGVRDKPARIVQRDAGGNLVGARITRYDGTGLGRREGEVVAGRITSEERLVLSDELVTAAYGPVDPRLAASGHHRRADVPGWWVWAVRYERAGLGGAGPATLRSTDPRGATQVVTFDDTRLFPVSVVDARGNETTVSRDRRASRVATLTDPNGALRRNEYDALGRIVAEFVPGDPDDDPAIRLRPVPDAPIPFTERTMAHRTGGADTVVQRDLFDAVGNLLARGTRTTGDVWVVNEASAYNWRGAVARRFVPHRATTDELAPAGDAIAHERFAYDELGRMLQNEHSDGTRRQAGYEPGRSTMLDEEDTHSGGAHEATATVFELDCAGRVRRVRTARGDAAELVTAYRYDSRNNPVEIVDPVGRSTVIVYDLEGRRLRVDDPDAGTTTFMYDAAGNLVERRNGLGQRVRNEYDELNRLRRVTAPDTADPDIRYDYLDQVDASSGTDVTGRAGRLHVVTDSLGTTTLSYDAAGELTAKHIARADGETFDLGRAVDRLGRLASVTYPAAGGAAAPVIGYHYDELGRMTAIDGVIDDVEYDDAGEATTIRHANGVTTTVEHDGRGRASSRAVTDAGGTVLERWTLEHDGLGNVVAVDDGFDPGRSWTYTLDDTYQLTRATRADGTDIEYRYDDAGNVVFRTDTGDLRYGEGGAPAGCVTSMGGQALGYDAIGRQTSGVDGTIGYDAMNRATSIVTASSSTVQQYGAFGEATVRRTTTPTGTATVYRLDSTVEIRAGLMVCAVFDGTRRLAQFTPGQPVEHLHVDHRGSVTLVTGKDGRVRQRLAYDPFGRVLAETSSAGFVDSGRRADGYEHLDDTAIHLVSGRLYDPRLGRFTTVDPVLSDLWDPIALNRYTYVANNPATISDPSGRAWWHVVLAALAVVAVVVLTIVTFGVGLIGLGAMIGVFAAMAAGAAVGGIAAARAGGGAEEILLGIFVGAALSGAAALGGAVIGVGLGAAFGTSSFLTHVLGGAASGLLLGAATGFATGFAGGMGSAGDIWEKTWKSALIGMALGIVSGVATYGFQQGWFGTGKLAVHGAKEPLNRAAERAAAEAARSAGNAANTGTFGASEAAGALAAGGKSFASNFYTFGGTSGLPVLEILVFNPVAQNLLITSGTSLWSLDVIDDLIAWLKENNVRI